MNQTACRFYLRSWDSVQSYFWLR